MDSTEVLNKTIENNDFSANQLSKEKWIFIGKQKLSFWNHQETEPIDTYCYISQNRSMFDHCLMIQFETPNKIRWEVLDMLHTAGEMTFNGDPTSD